jgi:hypothetical protein
VRSNQLSYAPFTIAKIRPDYNIEHGQEQDAGSAGVEAMAFEIKQIFKTNSPLEEGVVTYAIGLFNYPASIQRLFGLAGNI